MIRSIRGGKKVNNKGYHPRKMTKAWADARRILYGETTSKPDKFKHGEKKEP